MNTNPWLRPAITAIVICAFGAGGLRFLRSQQSHEPPPLVAAVPPPVEAPVAALDKRGPAPAPAPASEPAPAPAAVARPEPPRLPSAATDPTPPPPAPTPALAPAPTPTPVVAAATGPTTIRGVAKLASTPPRRSLIRMDADPKCAAMHADEPPLSEEVVTNADGRLRNVFVYLKSAPAGQTYAPPRTPVVLDQVGCAYTPRVLGMMARQPLLIRNSDDTLHNVHAMPRRSREFNIGQPNRGMETTRTFAEPEVMVKFKCDVHPWMAAYVGVLDHPFYAVTDDDGAFALPELPPGTYTVVAWHESLGTQEQTVTAPGAVTFTFAR